MQTISHNRNITKIDKIPLEQILPRHCTGHTISHLTKIPITSLNDHIPVKPNPANNPLVEDIEQGSDNDEENYNIRYNATMIKTLMNDYYHDMSYKPDFMEMNGTYDENITNPLTFNHIAEKTIYSTITVTMNTVWLL